MIVAADKVSRSSPVHTKELQNDDGRRQPDERGDRDRKDLAVEQPLQTIGHAPFLQTVHGRQGPASRRLKRRWAKLARGGCLARKGR